MVSDKRKKILRKMVGCRAARFFSVQHTKTEKNIPNNHKMSQMEVK
jgi:hypothetical protein